MPRNPEVQNTSVTAQFGPAKNDWIEKLKFTAVIVFVMAMFVGACWVMVIAP